MAILQGRWEANAWTIKTTESKGEYSTGAQKQHGWRLLTGLSFMVWAALQVPILAIDATDPMPGNGRIPTPEDSIEAEGLAREHFGDIIVDGAKSLTENSDDSLTERATRGNRITMAVTQLTGTAVNPLFGVTALGMHRYFTTPSEARDQLPFHNQPYVWGGLLLIMLLMLFNSTICETMPFLKVPLNALGDLVSKGGAAVVLPVALHEFARMFAVPAADMLAIAGSWTFPAAYAAERATDSNAWLAIGWLVSLTLGLFAYSVVWVVCNVIDVLILIMPIPFLDALLKSVRLGVMALVFGAAAWNPWLGLAVSLFLGAC